MTKNVLTMDFETRSEVDIKKLGPIKYAKHQSTEVMCLAFKFNDDKTSLWVPELEPFPKEVLESILSGEWVLTAHNAFFEQCIFKYTMKRYFKEDYFSELDPAQWKCTAAKAAACALPRNLDGVTQALDLPIKKDMEGNRLMKKYMKPTPQWKKWNLEGRKGLEPKKWYDDPLELWKIYEYCVTDTDAERLVDLRLPDLSSSEQAMWVLNQRANFSGVRVDLKAVRKIITAIKKEEIRLTSRLKEITNGELDSANKTAKVVSYVKSLGVELPNLQKKTVEDTLKDPKIPKVAREVLRIRAQVSKTSNKKYFSFIDRTDDDGRAKDILLWHGANTGRDSGVGIQFHNFPRGSHKNTDEIIEDILKYDSKTIRFLYGELSEVFSSCLRGMVIPSEGHTMFRADFNAIECRVLHWLAGNETVLNDFRNGVDQYKKMASRIYNLPIEKIDGGKKDGPQRFLGKTATLACGYGMGSKKFLDQCIAYNIEGITKELADRAVQVYRDTNHKIPRMWANLEKAAVMAIKRPGSMVSIHKITYYVKDGFLWCILPSGRRLAYYKPSLRPKKTPWGEPKMCVHYHAVDSQTRKFKEVHTYGGSLVENVCQAVSADILRNGQMNLVKNGFTYLFNVHDELVGEALTGVKTIGEFIKCMTTLPKWAEGLPVKAEGWEGPRFKK